MGTHYLGEFDVLWEAGALRGLTCAILISIGEVAGNGEQSMVMGKGTSLPR